MAGVAERPVQLAGSVGQLTIAAQRGAALDVIVEVRRSQELG